MQPRTPWLIAMGVAIGIGACERGPELEPAKTANTVAGMEDAVTNTQKGVRVTAQSIEWPGVADLSEQVTPLRVTIQNNSGQPVNVQYKNFRLVTSDGTAYRAMPPFEVTGTVDAEPTVVDYTPIVDPDFEYSGFYVAPYYANVYPHLDPYEGVLDMDYDYFDTCYGYWGDIEVFPPTLEMRRRALPEGSLQDGGLLAGFLYFRRVPDNVQVELRAELPSPATGQPPARLSLAFVNE